jgi:hypothetical protein
MIRQTKNPGSFPGLTLVLEVSPRYYPLAAALAIVATARRAATACQVGKLRIVADRVMSDTESTLPRKATSLLLYVQKPPRTSGFSAGDAVHSL